MRITTTQNVTIAEFGAPSVLTFNTSASVLEISDGQVLIENHFAGVNPVDCKTRAGLGWGAKYFEPLLPAVIGFDCAGVVVESRDDRFQTGDRVCALSFAGGTYAQHVAVDGDLLARVPESVDLREAGALPCAGTTAYQLIKQANLQGGEHVVMSAPAGGVGHLALQLLRDKNIRLTLIASAEKRALLGDPSDVDWIDYHAQDTFPALEADLLLDLVGGDAAVQALDTLKANARVICLPSIHVPLLQEAGAARGLQVEGFMVKPNADDLDALVQLLANKQLHVHIAETYPLSEASSAHTAQESGRTFGKIVLNTTP
ncbi:NADP-dependent oxidoreductase [Suttonella sp. R2A3]|uniref:NADP-dependent oxidoreductase n=1 Tax=Suttonella sp. R2A3 TaxID=2908648 RepID=UPI001F386647|nr:NADP-dependent oxidoreductase [Suttonella sp. R2A3]UJF23785.1 NADP-dependent oxidoreductase [Suttonella sp. R2A3]